MSLETWMRKFYPVDADKTRGKDAITHSLLKWEGLKPTNTKKHYITVTNGDLVYKNEIISITGDTCALCHHFYDASVLNGKCGLCPIYQVHRRTCQHEYNIWVDKKNPLPMISLLKKTKKGVKS